MADAEAEKVEQLKKLNETMVLILTELRNIKMLQQQMASRPGR